MPKKILVRKRFHYYGSVFDYQVVLSLVLAELQLLFEGPIFQPLGPAVALVKKIFWHYRIQHLLSVEEKLFFFYSAEYNFNWARPVS